MSMHICGRCHSPVSSYVFLDKEAHEATGAMRIDGSEQEPEYFCMDCFFSVSAGFESDILKAEYQKNP